MLAEAWRYWTAFAPARVRRFGYLARLVALEFRARRCAAAWAPHLAACRRAILTAADHCARRDLCLIVGSGLLLDVPLAELAARFGRVMLVDMFHMPQVRRQVRPFKNVRLLSGDVTGMFQMMKDGKVPGPQAGGPELPAPPARIPHLTEADLAVSCNCLTQLAGPFVAHLEATRGFSDLDSDKLAYQIMEHHARAFAEAAPDVGMIISDVERYEFAKGEVARRIDLLKAYTLPPPLNPALSEEWDWLIAPAGEEGPDDIEHLVEAKLYTRDALPAAAPPPDSALS
ncbi:MAG: hypothetical protein SFV21_20825 [Rhodospirillaceae bacterium]|nr:hypothetical protein [Rhodospirillaceae bacterium]